MSDHNFTGAIPATYEQYMGPVFFEPYAADLAGRLAESAPIDALELAAGTGILTRALRARLPQLWVLATDRNLAMLAHGRAQTPDPQVSWCLADAMALPFGDRRVDAVVCQFGAMFFPDRRVALADARRTLRPDGLLLFNVWDSVDANPVVAATRDIVRAQFPRDPPSFLEQVPHGYHDPTTIRDDVLAAGFDDVDVSTVVLRAPTHPARSIATGLCAGTPMRNELAARGVTDLEPMIDAVTAAIADRCGGDLVAAELSAVVVTARTLRA